jgi:mRNA interferase MazF
MGKPIVGDVVVLPFPQSNLSAGKRRPALVVADIPGVDLVLCQITTQQRQGSYTISVVSADFQNGRLSQDCYARANRLFTVDSALILYTVGNLKAAKTNEILEAIRSLFSPVN